MHLNVGILVLSLVCLCFFAEGFDREIPHKGWIDKLENEISSTTAKSTVDLSSSTTVSNPSISTTVSNLPSSTDKPTTSNPTVESSSSTSLTKSTTVSDSSISTTVSNLPSSTDKPTTSNPTVESSSSTSLTKSTTVSNPSTFTDKPTTSKATEAPLSTDSATTTKSSTSSVQTTTVPPSDGIVDESFKLADGNPAIVNVKVVDYRPYVFNITFSTDGIIVDDITVNVTMCNGDEKSAQQIIQDFYDGSYIVSQAKIEEMVQKFCLTQRRSKRSTPFILRLYVFANNGTIGEDIHIAGKPGPEPPTPPSNTGLDAGWIVTIVLACILLIVIAVCIGVIICLVRKNRASSRHSDKEAIWRPEDREDVTVPAKISPNITPKISPPTQTRNVYMTRPMAYGNTSTGYQFNPNATHANTPAGYGSTQYGHSVRPSMNESIYQMGASNRSDHYGHGASTAPSVYPRIFVKPISDQYDQFDQYDQIRM